jgi:hypothetical protein
MNPERASKPKQPTVVVIAGPNGAGSPQMSRPQTILNFLTTRDTRRMRLAEITTGIFRVIEVPHSQLTKFLKSPEAQQEDSQAKPFWIGFFEILGIPNNRIATSLLPSTPAKAKHEIKTI